VVTPVSSEPWSDRCSSLAKASSDRQLRRMLLAQAGALSDLLRPRSAAHGEWAKLGIDVRRRQMLSAGAGVDMPTHRLIYVRATDDYLRQRFTVAHEVAHLLLSEVHAAGRIYLSQAAEERLCDEFAATFLIPPGELSAALRSITWDDPDELLQLCHRFGVGIQPIMISLAESWSHPGVLVLVGQKMGHPRRPDEIATRVLAHAGPDHFFIPRTQRFASLGLTELAHWADDATQESRSSGTDFVTLKVWSKAAAAPRTGVHRARGHWRAHRLNNGITLAVLHLSYAQQVEQLGQAQVSALT
jgi:IrrE N-terminal-like domain